MQAGRAKCKNISWFHNLRAKLQIISQISPPFAFLLLIRHAKIWWIAGK
jgi:hypothetical protein